MVITGKLNVMTSPSSGLSTEYSSLHSEEPCVSSETVFVNAGAIDLILHSLPFLLLKSRMPAARQCKCRYFNNSFGPGETRLAESLRRPPRRAQRPTEVIQDTRECDSEPVMSQ
jgi:hypothetical protein